MGTSATVRSGSNWVNVKIGSLTLYFSYQTCIAFCYGGRCVVRENCWGPTTGKHLNAIDGGDKKARVSSAVFEAALDRALSEAALAKITKAVYDTDKEA